VTEPALDRALGALIGLAVGDALGAPVEFCSRGSFEPVTGMRSFSSVSSPARIRSGSGTSGG
jgi:ADP-ribosylglycohydrolase